jgi:hypothetical protein
MTLLVIQGLAIGNVCHRLPPWLEVRSRRLVEDDDGVARQFGVARGIVEVEASDIV